MQARSAAADNPVRPARSTRSIGNSLPGWEGESSLPASLAAGTARGVAYCAPGQPLVLRATTASAAPSIHRVLPTRDVQITMRHVQEAKLALRDRPKGIERRLRRSS